MSNFVNSQWVEELTHAEKDDGKGNPHHCDDVLHIISSCRLEVDDSVNSRRRNRTFQVSKKRCEQPLFFSIKSKAQGTRKNSPNRWWQLRFKKSFTNYLN